MKENGEAVTLAIEDSGIGIAPEDITKIFDRYYQVDAEGSASGTGIGLAIVKEFMVLHNGSVEVKSVLGEGSVFELSFPISHQSEKGTVPYAVSSIESMDPLKPSILVVEDNQDMRHYLDLHMNEYNIYEAANGQESFEFVRNYRHIRIPSTMPTGPYSHRLYDAGDGWGYFYTKTKAT